MTFVVVSVVVVIAGASWRLFRRRRDWRRPLSIAIDKKRHAELLELERHDER